jgi:hypothetical protein
MTTAAAVMRDYGKGLRGTRLVRAMIGAEAWSTPSKDGRPLLLAPHGDPWLNLFSNDTAMVKFCALHNLDDSFFMSLPGHSLFDGIAPALAGINFDTDTPDGFHYRRSQFAMLQSVVDAMKIEAFLHGAKSIDDPFSRMKRYADYIVLERPGGGWMLAPDEDGRRLLAINMTDDTADALQAQVRVDLNIETVQRRLDGRALFTQIKAQQGLDGLVFNPRGVVKPRAMAVAIAGHVLGATG